MDNGSVPPEVSPPVSDPGTGPAWGMAASGDSLHHTDRDILLSLGAAVVAQWASLPRDVQKALFMSASSGPSFDPAATRNHIARFLHDSGNAPLEKAGHL